MGDLSTHREIYASTARPALVEGLGIPKSLALCFELGNWLRDVSQFRDPYALQLAKITKFKEFPKIGGNAARRALDHLFGPNPAYDTSDIVAGAWGAWFKEMMTAFGAIEFTVAGVMRQEVIAEADFKRLFDRHYTQYFPHEHLDFPPTGDERRLGDWTTASARTQGARGPTRRILAYLDDDIDYVAAMLLRAEQDLRVLFAPTQRRNELWLDPAQDALVRLGRASHALEDYYFHSNFPEIAYLLEPIGDRVADLQLSSFFRIPAAGLLDEEHKRILFRRTRAPVLATARDGTSILSTEGSLGAANVFTGMFGSTDLYHTLDDAFQGLAGSPATAFVLSKLDSTLWNYVLLPERRKELVMRDAKGHVVPNDDKVKEIARQHIKEARSEKLVRSAETNLAISPLCVASIKRANQIDIGSFLESEERSIGFVLLTLASQVEAEAQTSAAAAQAMDRSPQDRFYLASDNGDGGEAIGTHSLMSKDSVRKQPLRQETDALARFAVGTVMKTLLPRTHLGADKPYVDWRDLLRRLMCHPAQAPADWAHQFVAKRKQPAASVFAPATVPAAQVPQLLTDGGRITSALQNAYRALYQAAAAEYARLSKP